MSFLGATSDLDAERGPFLVFDLGGGSTEFVYGTDDIEASISVDVGCVRMTERFLEHDPPLAEELSAAISLTDTYLDDVMQAIPDAGAAATFVGLAGTITNVAAVEMGLPEYDPDAIHHFVLTRDAAEDVFRTLATEPHDARIHNPGLEPARADVIVGGTCVLVGDHAPLRDRRAARVRGRHPRRPRAVAAHLTPRRTSTYPRRPVGRLCGRQVPPRQRRAGWR